MNRAEIIGQKFLDNHGYEHTVTKILGEGGQGMVCLTETPGYVLKFVLDDKGSLLSKEKNDVAFKYYNAVFKNINHLPIKNNDHIAIPVAVLTDYIGYVMRLMEDMDTMENILCGAPDTYSVTGGHRHRLELLSKCASILATIHSKGMVYCDLHSENVFVTKDIKSKNQNVWFIDTDNLFYPSKNGYKKLVGKPRYAAPEIVYLLGKESDESCTQNSDLYSFAVMAYECLSMIHPFAGETAINGENSDDDWDSGWDTSSEEDDDISGIDPQYSGKYSWVNDPDNTNTTSAGFPWKFFLTQELFNLFQQTFGEGRQTPTLRPTAYFWQKALANASDVSVECPCCSMSFIYEFNKKSCPYCHEKLPMMIKMETENRECFTRELLWKENSSVSNEIEIPERIFLPFDSKFNSISAIRVTASKDGERIAVTLKKSENVYFSDNLQINIVQNETTTPLLGALTIVMTNNESFFILTKFRDCPEKRVKFSLEAN